MTSKRGSNRRKGAPALPGAGRKPKALEDRREIRIAITPEIALLAQRLMLRPWPGVRTVEDLFAYALRRLAETE